MRITRAQAREIDRRAIEELGIPGVVLMENAASAIASSAINLLMLQRDDRPFDRVLILSGGGNNGGDGFAAARHIAAVDQTIQLTTLCTKSLDQLTGDARTNADICQRLGISIKAATPQAIADSKANVVVDALFGIGLTAPPREREAALIRAVNDLQTSVVSVDVPSGLDCDNGVPLGDAAIYADETVTMFAEKAGFPADPYTGCIHVETLTIPEAWIESVL